MDPNAEPAELSPEERAAQIDAIASEHAMIAEPLAKPNAFLATLKRSLEMEQDDMRQLLRGITKLVGGTVLARGLAEIAFDPAVSAHGSSVEALALLLGIVGGSVAVAKGLGDIWEATGDKTRDQKSSQSITF